MMDMPSRHHSPIESPSMYFRSTEIEDVVLILPGRIMDARGYFSETFRDDLFKENVAPVDFVQENQSFSSEIGTVRGLHYQTEPHAQGKLVRCLSGAILDVAVDLRKASPTYGRHVRRELSAENGLQLWIPPGFAHGFCTLSPSTTVFYKVTDYYSPDHDRGVQWNDPALAIKWPVSSDGAILSDKDRSHPRLADAEIDLSGLNPNEYFVE